MATREANTSHVIRFGLYEADLSARELRRNGKLVKLQDRPFEVLVILLEHPGDVITREEFRNRLWPADTFVDFDASLNTSVNKLRQALGDHAENPCFIATVGRRGYRFIAPASTATVSDPAAETKTPTPEKEAQVPVPVRRFRIAVALGIGLICVIGIALVAILPPEPQPRVLNLVQITHDGLLDPWGKLTTDGARIFYLDRTGGHWNLMQAPASGGEAQPFAEPSQNMRVVDISPDRSELLTFTFVGRSSDLPMWLTPVVGGLPRRVGNIVADDAVFASDGRRIFYNRADGIYSCERDGSQVRKLVTLPSHSEEPQWSRDGMRLRFTLFDARTSRPSIWEVSADGGNLHKVNLNLPEPDESYGGGWSTDGRYFFFNSTRDGTHSVWVIRDGGRRWLRGSAKPVQLTFSPDSYGGLITSEDPRRFFAWSGSEQLETARYYPDSGRVEPLLPGTHARQVIPSPDGAWLTYAVGGELWRSRPDGTMRQALVSGFSTINQIVWSPNAARILFHAVDSGKKEGFFTVSTAGGALTEAALGSGHNEAGWTDDGRGIVFAKWPAEGQVTLEQSGIFVFDLRNSRITRIPGSEGLVHPMFSPDGRFLAAITNFDSNPSQPTRVMLYDSRTQIWKEIGHGALVNPAQWSKDSKSFYYQDILSEGQRSFRYSTAANKTEAFVDFEGLLRAGYVRCSFLGISGDGSLLMSLRRNEVNIFRLDMDLP